MLRFILIALLIWFLYNLVFRLIVPIAITTRQMKKKFREMHERMQEEEMGQQHSTAPTGHRPPGAGQAPDKSDYIDFEEVK